MTTTNATGVLVDHRIGVHGKLAIRLASAEVRLAAADGDRVTVRTAEGRPLPDRVVIETTDDGLSIREKGVISFGRGHRVIQLEIHVPAEAEIAVESASGWVDGQGLRGEQRYRTVSGDLSLRAGAGRIDVNAVSGDMRLDLAAAASIAIKSVSGDVTLTGGRLDALRIQTTSGDVRVDSPLIGRSGNAIETLSGDVDVVVGDGIRVEARTVSGDLSTNLPHRSEGRMGRRTIIVGDGEIELGFRSVSGDLRIREANSSAAAALALAPAWAMAPEPADAPEPPEFPDRPAMPEMPEMPELPEMPRFADAPWTTDQPATDVAAPFGEPSGTDADESTEAERMSILRSLEQGDLDVATAMDLLAVLDQRAAADQAGPAGEGVDV